MKHNEYCGVSADTIHLLLSPEVHICELNQYRAAHEN
jgi:hypothetical protein